MISRVRYCGEPPLDYPAMFLDLPDVARDWLGSYHAALALNNMSDEGRMYKRSEFERFYEKWTKTAPLNPVLLPVNEEVEKQLAAERQKPLLPPKRGYDGWYSTMLKLVAARAHAAAESAEPKERAALNQVYSDCKDGNSAIMRLWDDISHVANRCSGQRYEGCNDSPAVIVEMGEKWEELSANVIENF